MKRAVIIFAVALLVSCFAATAVADVWLDAVISFDQPAGSSNEGDLPEDALGPPDDLHVSIDIPETFIAAFIDNTALDGPGKDLHVYQDVAGDSDVDIYGSKDNLTYVYLGRTDADVEYDLASYPGLDYVNYLKFVGLDNGGSDAGYDLDAVKALNSGAHVPEPSTLVLLTMGALALLSYAWRRRGR